MTQTSVAINKYVNIHDLPVQMYAYTVFFLWDISHPTKNGAPTIIPTADDEILPSTRKASSTFELAVNLVITKTFKHYDIPLHITDKIRTTFKAKLW